MPDNKRMIESYEVKHALHLAGGEVILAEDMTAAEPFMVCDCDRNNPFSMDVYTNIGVSADYLEVMREFLKRVEARVEQIESERAQRGVTSAPLTADDCIKGSYRENYKDRLVVVKPEKMTPSARTADRQLLLAESGNGCSPDARGTAVFCKNLFTGEIARWERYDIAGIIDPARMSAWAAAKLTALKEPANRQSVIARLDAAKKEAAHDNHVPKGRVDKGPEL